MGHVSVTMEVLAGVTKTVIASAHVSMDIQDNTVRYLQVYIFDSNIWPTYFEIIRTIIIL